jgi:hypothetical protein
MNELNGIEFWTPISSEPYPDFHEFDCQSFVPYFILSNDYLFLFVTKSRVPYYTVQRVLGCND